MAGENQIYFLNFAARATQKKSMYIPYTTHILFEEH